MILLNLKLVYNVQIFVLSENSRRKNQRVCIIGDLSARFNILSIWTIWQQFFLSFDKYTFTFAFNWNIFQLDILPSFWNVTSLYELIIWSRKETNTTLTNKPREGIRWKQYIYQSTLTYFINVHCSKDSNPIIFVHSNVY